MSRAPWRKGAWSPEEIAATLHRRHDVLLAELRRHTAMSGIPADAVEEIFIDAMHAVVIEYQKPILNEEHLRGAFFASARHRAMRRWEGRHLVGVGGMTRVHDFDAVQTTISEDQGPEELVAQRDLVVRARDWMQSLTAFEQTVQLKMAIEGKSYRRIARDLDCPRREVEAAQRSIRTKLERVAIVATVRGSICSLRQDAVTTAASGEATVHEHRTAQLHVAACTDCRVLYGQLRREMLQRDFQCRAATAFLPLPAAPAGHNHVVERLASWLGPHSAGGRAPTGERVAAALGGGGIVKATAAGTAVLLSATALTHQVLHSLTGHPTDRRAHIAAARKLASARQVPRITRVASSSSAPVRSLRRLAATGVSRPPRVAHKSKSLPPLPNRGSGYLALDATPPAPTSPRASTASNRTSSSSGSTASSGRGGPPPATPKSGGGTSLSYLGG